MIPTAFDKWADKMPEYEQRERAWEERRREKRKEKQRHREYVDEITPDRAEWKFDSSRYE